MVRLFKVTDVPMRFIYQTVRQGIMSHNPYQTAWNSFVDEK